MEHGGSWYEALGLTAAHANTITGKDVGSSLKIQVAEMVFAAADVDALKPLCVVFKALFNAVQGAAENRSLMVGLIDYGVLIVRSIPETTTKLLSKQVQLVLSKFAEEVDGVMLLARDLGGERKPVKLRHKIMKHLLLGKHAVIKDAIQRHETRFDRLVGILGTSATFQTLDDVDDVLAGVAQLITTTSEDGEEIKRLVRTSFTWIQRLLLMMVLILMAAAVVVVLMMVNQRSMTTFIRESTEKVRMIPRCLHFHCLRLPPVQPWTSPWSQGINPSIPA